jgi:Spy/CpxP family protein refolding chaperone
MKTLFSALALVIAAPLAAQSAPATDPHAGHKQETPHKDHGGKHEMDCCKKGCCDKMKQPGQKMSCCEKGSKAPADQHKGH